MKEIKVKIQFDTKKVKTVPVEQVRPNTWNPKDKNTQDFEKVKRGISLKGQRLPIIVRETGEKETLYEIIDGEQRWASCKALGFKNVLIYNEGKLSDKEAKELTIWFQQQVPFNEIELAGLVKDITMNLEGLELELPFTQTEVDEFMKLSDFDWNQYDTNEIEPEYEGGVRTLSLKMPESQYKIIMEAIEKVKTETNSNDARALELICADFLNAPEGTTGIENE
jgi:hypothetical protein